MTAPALVIAAPGSGHGKTTVAVGLMAALAARGRRVAAAKVGPDYIDPGFHALACGRPSENLDSWAMRPPTLAAAIARAGADADLAICEGAMGLFDGADAAGAGSTAEIAALTGWPTVLVVDARGQGASAAATVAGFARHRADVAVVGAIFNRLGGPRHEATIRAAMAAHVPDIVVLGAIPRDPALALPERHLGLVAAGEIADVRARIAGFGEAIAAGVDLDRLAALARPAHLAGGGAARTPPLGSRIAVARDDAFVFAYPAALADWRAQGAEIAVFSPLADEGPDGSADAVFLPGGYPELHAGRLAAAARFRAGLAAAAERGAFVYGECGGYMALGRVLIDADGVGHRMAGLLPLETSFAARRLQLGYRAAALAADGPLGPRGARFRGHEFHYASAVAEAGEPLYAETTDAAGRSLGPGGLKAGRVAGAFVHLVDAA